MKMKYVYSDEWTKKARSIALELGMNYIQAENIACIKSFGSKSKRVIARIHSKQKVIQIAFNEKAAYVIELVSEKFDKLSEEEKTKTIIHELMHIPKSFGGGFRHHKGYITQAKVEANYKKLKEKRN